MNAPTVPIAVSRTMFTSPINAAPPKMVPLDTSSPPVWPPALVSRSPTLLFSLLHTPMPPSTRYRNATAIIQTKNSATDSTSDTFNALHGSTLRICMLARTGPLCWRVPTWMRLGAGLGRAAGSGGGPPGAGFRCAGGRGVGAGRGGSPPGGYPGSFGELTYGSLTSLCCVGLGGVRLGLLGVARNSNQCVALAQVHQPNALGLPPGLADLASRRPDDTSTRGDGVQLRVVVDDQRSDQTATPPVELDRQHPFAATALDRVL